MNEDVKNHVSRALEQNVRYDGRKVDEFRDVSVELNVSKTAEGSARVTIGDTVVIAGVKLGMDKPYPDSPENGNLMVNAELLPLSSDEFETGPPSIDAIELARIMDRSVRESQALDTADLCVEPGEKVWSIMCDICTINDAGNLFDAASIALISALKSARFPSLDEGKVDYKKKTETPLPITKIPLGITVWKVGDKFIVDPLKVEQRAMDARLTVGTLDDGTICALQKGGEGTLSVEDIAAMIDLSIDHADSIRKIIKKTIGE